MPFAPYSGYLTLVFLLGVLVLMALDPEKGPWVIAALLAAVPALIGGWYLVRNRVTSAAAALDEPTADVAELAPE
jgi:L-asparagine permease